MCQLGKTTKQTINEGIRKTSYYFEITMVVTQAIFLWSMWFYPLVKRRMRDDSQLNQELRRYKSLVITQRQTGPLVLSRQCKYNNNSNVKKRQKKTNTFFQKQIWWLEETVDDVEQYGRRNSIATFSYCGIMFIRGGQCLLVVKYLHLLSDILL